MNGRIKAIVGTSGGIAGLAIVAIAAGQAASGWDLSWSGVTGGGGKSSGGGYELQAAIVPVDGSSSGGTYVVQGGLLAGESTKFKGFMPVVAKDGVN